MKLSTRLTRAAVAFLIFGTVAAALPTSGTVQAQGLGTPCPGIGGGNGRGRGHNPGRDFGIATAILAGGVAAGGSHGGMYPYRKKKNKNERNEDQTKRLDKFIYSGGYSPRY